MGLSRVSRLLDSSRFNFFASRSPARPADAAAALINSGESSPCRNLAGSQVPGVVNLSTSENPDRLCKSGDPGALEMLVCDIAQSLDARDARFKFNCYG